MLLFCGLGYMFGNEWEFISSISEDVMGILILMIVLAVLYVMIMMGKNEKYRR